MATDLMWQRTQLGFSVAQGQHVAPGNRIPPAFVPQRTYLDDAVQNTKTTSGMFPSSAAFLTNQLQFNIGAPSSPENLATRIRKPKPIVIEKLGVQENENKLHQTFVSRSIEGQFPFSANSSVSSERLAFAINLARRDIKKARFNPAEIVWAQEVLGRPSDKSEKTQGKGKGKAKKTKQTDPSNDGMSLRERVQKTLRKHEKEKQGLQEVHFFSGREADLENNSDDPQTTEIKKLRKDLYQCMNQLENLQNQRPTLLRNRDKRIKRRAEDNLRLSADEPDPRQVIRAEEQASRSSRMLYMLQRQVRDLQDELTKTGTNIKHTKKSKTLSRLAAAHRAALRALQTFISQAPLQPKVGSGLPPMYQDLAILIRQLSLLTTQLQIGSDDLSEEMLAGEPKYTKGGHQPIPSAFQKDIDAAKHASKKRLLHTNVHRTPNPSPERNAVLQAGIEALMRARQNITQTPFSAPKATLVPRPTAINKPAKKSLLLPQHLQAKRERIQQAGKSILKPSGIGDAGFAQDTVSSKLRKVIPEHPGEENNKAQPYPTTPPQTPTKQVTPTKSPRGTPTKKFGTPERLCEKLELSPRSPRRRLDHELPPQSPRSPKYARQMVPQERDLMEREITRQAWLDREAQLRVQEMDELRTRGRRLDGQVSDGVQLARRMIRETEEAIVHRLRPLLDRAEAIVKENTLNEQEKKRSLRRQLASLASETTMAQADTLADMLLDDLLEDTVEELERLEDADEVNQVAAGMLDSTTLENIRQRLESFEREEDAIRRRWQQVEYAEPDSQTFKPRTKPSGGNAFGHPGPIMFTMPHSHNDRIREKIDRLHERSRTRRETLDSTGTASLLEGISSPSSNERSSDDIHQKRTHSPRPSHARTTSKIALFVPTELRASITAYRSKYERYLRDTATHVHGSFNPWKLVDEISEGILDEMLVDIAGELEGACEEYAEGVYTQEFAVLNASRQLRQDPDEQVDN
ncbi:protein moonraker [Nematostella vectensis]|uniref:protein moonraker n=1 Tax=Nematostella vectensis TaxID=45351 RepID=UPI0020776215|nr:protein moonraker [Nematostella vectensis]XP_048582173.1 protein moonraker [Nematostella vectensis]